MDFPSIVTSTSDLNPHLLHDENIEMSNDVLTLPAPSNQDRRGPGLRHLAVVTAFLLPFTVFPYMLARRQILALRRQLAETRTSVKVLEQELNLSWQEMSSRKDDIHKLRGSVWKMQQDGEHGKMLSERKEQEELRFQEEVKTELQVLLKEARNSRSHGATIASLGTSLADVAAFMHEMELEMGMQSSRNHGSIERLRYLALQMQEKQSSERSSEPKVS
ncbi:hypothetical protein H0H92_004788 [Tricholoma furcatifolium]|nr:hypothetical protein H0H92_004788 [Tricholoma furcatifolium]